MKIAIIGGTGMLGSMVTSVFTKSKYDLVITTRQTVKPKDHYNSYKFLNVEACTDKELISILDNCSYAINCVGIIKPYIHDDNAAEVERAIAVNACFPHKLAAACAETRTKLIQIATDCVYDGITGGYNEKSPHNAIDVYGKTKSLGEVISPHVMNLRCSIIGPEVSNKLSLLEWFLQQPQAANIKGFKNHLWNGITTYQFAKICLGIIKNETIWSNIQHIIPADIVSKAQILHYFSEIFDRRDINITDIDVKESVARDIVTIYISYNELLWNNAGYEVIPSIKDMILEMRDYAKSF